MKKLILSLALIAAVAGLYSCGSESENLVPEPGTPGQEQPAGKQDKVLMTFHAGFYGQEDSKAATSKTVIGERDDENKTISLLFSPGDRINVSGELFTCDLTEKPSKECNFTGFANEEFVYWAITPLSGTLTYGDTEDMQFSAPLPSSQKPISGTFDPAAHVMVALTRTNAFHFKTANAFLKFTAPCDLKCVDLIDNNGDDIAGSFTVHFSEKSGIFKVDDGDHGVITMSGEMKKDSTYYISIIPGTFSKGLTITYTASDGRVASYSTAENLVIEPNHVKTFKKLDESAFAHVVAEKIYCKDLSAYLDKCSENVVTTVYLADYDNQHTLAPRTNYLGETVMTPKEYGVLWTALTNHQQNRVRLILPDDIEINSIEDFAFVNCESLVDIVLPSGVKKIGNHAFNGCKSLVGFNLDGIESIGVNAFLGCNFAELTIPESVTSIGDYAFAYSRLASITIPNSVVEMGEYICEGSNLTDVTIAAKVIGDNSFKGLKTIKKLTIWYGVETIGESAFYNCEGITSLSIPSTVKSIGNNAFKDCSYIEKITIAEGVESIGEYAFFNCVYVQGDLTIPSTVKSIGAYAFSNNEHRTGFDGQLTLYEGLEEIGECAFYNCRLLSGELTIPSTVKSIGKDAFNECMFKKITISEGIESIDDRAFAYAFDDHSLGVSIPKTVKSIGVQAFQGYKHKNLTIPEGVKSIGKGALASLNLQSVAILGDLTSFGDSECDVFSKCEHNLKVYVTPDTYDLINNLVKDSDGKPAGIAKYAEMNVTFFSTPDAGKANTDTDAESLSNGTSF